MNKRVLWIILAILMFMSSIILIVYWLWGNGMFGLVSESSPTTTYEQFTYPSLTDPSVTATDPAGQTSETSETTEYVSPVDFEQLQKVNSDIIGWIYMSNPAINLPVLRSPDDDSFYLYHDAAKEYAREGSLFVEHEYNSDDFSDMCTIIYGHRMSNGTMFGTMQAVFSEEGAFDDPQYIVIYLPHSQKIYQICATIPADSRHILYYNDFYSMGQYEEFIDSVYNTEGVEVNLLEDLRPRYGERLLILSSCLWGDRSSRYLVIAKEIGS